MRVAIAIPSVRAADPTFNAEHTLALLQNAARSDAILALFPELGLSAYSCDDLFHQQALIEGSLQALRRIADASRAWLVAVVGVPLQVDHLLSIARSCSAKSKSLAWSPRPICRTIASFANSAFLSRLTWPR
ncbi:MAG TPA: nitrilase-related carbon-nitrogen hydrolase [Bryobacteraceae bacterium]|nr:nitrilase-related carbon-nitrogen hydrolase [Bryobacteraceae bacterium]